MSDQPFYESSFQRQKEQARARLEQYDLAAVMAMPEGRRMITNQLRNFGLGKQLANDPAQLALYNAGLVYFRELAMTSEKTALEILANVFGLNLNHSGEHNG